MWASALLVIGALSGAHPTRVLTLRGGGLDVKSMLEAAKDPEAVAELQQLMANPEALAEARELMDDPEFRAQVREALAAGGSGGLAELQEQLSSQKETLNQGLARLGPSLGAALDLLKEEVSAEELESACVVLTSLVRRRLKLGADAIGADGPRVRLANEKLHDALLRHAHGRRCLTALGFTEEVEDDATGAAGAAADAPSTYLELGSTVVLDERQLKRALGVIDEALVAAAHARELATAHELPYALALSLPTVRRCCRGDEALGRDVTQLLLEHKEFRATVCAPAVAELAMPSILPLLRSTDGLRALLEFYTGAGPPEGTRVVDVHSVSEWKEQLDAAGERLVVAFFSNSLHLGCRVLSSMFLRLPDANGAELAHVAFVRVHVDARQDDGLTEQVYAECGVPPTDVPTFAFFADCLELRKWRLSGSTDAGELLKRIRRIAADPRDAALDDGPDGDDGAEGGDDA